MFSAETEGLNAVTASFNRATGTVGAGVSKLVRTTALDIESTAKQIAPIRTGNLRRSITHEVTGDGRHGAMDAVIGTDVSYAPYLEFGTSRMAPHAFLGPALDRHAPDFVAKLAALGADL